MDQPYYTTECTTERTTRKNIMDTKHFRTLGVHTTIEFYEMVKFIAHELHHTSISKYVTDLITEGMDDKDIDLYKYQKKSERISS